MSRTYESRYLPRIFRTKFKNRGRKTIRDKELSVRDVLDMGFFVIGFYYMKFAFVEVYLVEKCSGARMQVSICLYGRTIIKFGRVRRLCTFDTHFRAENGKEMTNLLLGLFSKFYAEDSQPFLAINLCCSEYDKKVTLKCQSQFSIFPHTHEYQRLIYDDFRIDKNVINLALPRDLQNIIYDFLGGDL